MMVNSVSLLVVYVPNTVTKGNPEWKMEMILLHNSYNNLTAERDQLQTSYNILSERDQWQKDTNDLQKKLLGN